MLKQSKPMPPALTQEKPAANLASLAMSESLEYLTGALISHWQVRDRFSELKKFGIRPLDRALFYGPPGNGKTMSAQLVAQKIGCPLYRVCCESLLASEFGRLQKNLIEVMDWLAMQPLCVVLWDECETIFPSRGTMQADACSNAIASTMQLFWQRLDRWESPQIFLLATNIVDRIDPALLSRIELKIEFGPPTIDQCKVVLEYWREVFHEYKPDSWGGKLAGELDSGVVPGSFRELWQSISSSVRDVVVTE